MGGNAPVRPLGRRGGVGCGSGDWGGLGVNGRSGHVTG